MRSLYLQIIITKKEVRKVIFEVLGLTLTEEERLAVYRAVVALVKNRLVKARSV